MDIFVAIGVCIAGIGIWLMLIGVRQFRRSAITPHDSEKWQAHAGKQGFAVPWNMSLDIVVAFVRAWRRQDAARKIGLGAAVFAFGLIVAIVDAQLLTSAGEIVVVLYQYLGVVFYPPIIIAAYFGISSLSRQLRAGGQRTSQRPLRDYRHPLVPALCVVLLLGYVVLLVIVMAQLTHGFDSMMLAQVLTWPEVWGLLFGLVVMLVAILVTEVVARRIIALPAIPFPPANGWERLANYVLRRQAIVDCSTVTLFALIVPAFSSSFLFDVRPLDQSGMDGWHELYIVLVALAGTVIAVLTLFHAPSPSPTPVDATPETAAQLEQ